MGLVWIDRRRVPASRALRPAPGFRPLDGPRRGALLTAGLPASVYRQYLEGLARIHRKGS